MKDFPDDLVIKGNRVKLIPITLHYSDVIFKEFTEEIVRYLDLDTPPSAVEETREFIKLSINQRQEGTDLVMVILDGSEFIGVCGIHDIKADNPRMGLWLKKTAHCKGYGKESVRILIDWARSNIEFNHITYTTHIDNKASIRIIESVGGVFSGNTPNKANHYGYLITPD